MQITYQKLSLFDAPPGSVIIHACNAKSVWGSGIASAFKSLYPDAFEKYSKVCEVNDSRQIVGKGYLFEAKQIAYFDIESKNVSPSSSYIVGCLITSENYGEFVDSPSLIKINTTLALNNLCEKLSLMNIKMVYSNKFNSGLFKVPWNETELILKTVLEKFPQIEWIICDPKLGE